MRCLQEDMEISFAKFCVTRMRSSFLVPLRISSLMDCFSKQTCDEYLEMTDLTSHSLHTAPILAPLLWDWSKDSVLDRSLA
jgi:hypothetical protein